MLCSTVCDSDMGRAYDNVDESPPSLRDKIIKIKSLILPKLNKSINYKSSKILAIKYFNLIPNVLTILQSNRKTIPEKLKNWIINYNIIKI